MKHVNIKINGRVQGVFFRLSAKKMADKLSIKGFAKNMPDGSLYIEAEGDEEGLDQFISWCKKGPKLAKVSKISSNYSKYLNYSDFLTK